MHSLHAFFLQFFVFHDISKPVYLPKSWISPKITNTVLQPSIAGEGEGEVEGDAMEEHVLANLLVGEEKDLMEDDLREYHKVDFVNTIASLRIKPAHLFRLQILLCQMVPMPTVRPILSCDLGSYKFNA